MGLEGTITKVSDLNPLWPLPGDLRSFGDDHIRKVKEAVLLALPTVEIPTGTKNGTNLVFTLAVAPTILLLYLNGILQTATTDFSRTTVTITMVAPPVADDVLIAIYWR